MRVWLINSSEAVPTDTGDVRLRRMGLLAQRLVGRGHDVLWWSATFLHSLKAHRFPRDTAVAAGDHYRLRFLYAPGYRRNISLSRLWNHYVLGRKFRRQSRTESPPDVVLCSFPTLELSAAAVKYGKRAEVPVVLDVRDIWPDIFLDLVPRWARGPARLALWPLFRLSRTACAGAFAITGHAPAFVDWGLTVGRRRRTRFDRDFPYGYAVHRPAQETLAQATRFWKEHALCDWPEVPIVCFFGQIGHQFEMETVIEAARRLQGKREVLFVLCGAGVRLQACRKMAADCRNVLFPGWVNAPEIWTLMQRSSLALAPYVQRPDFQASIPNKSIEYLSGGLPVLTSLKQGVLPDLLAENDCGLSYGGDPQRLVEMIELLCDRPQRRNIMAENASRLFEARFTASKVYDEMAGYLEDVADAGKSQQQQQPKSKTRLPQMQKS